MLETYKWVRPEEIEARSMEIIERELRQKLVETGPQSNPVTLETRWTKTELSIVKRCIHTSADFDYADNLYFSPGAAERALSLLGPGTTIVTDTQMTLAGINKKALERLGCRACCFMAEEDVAREARERGVTRAAVSMERAAALSGPVIFAIGNAPTALLRLAEMTEAGELSPALVIGVPVGFVNVVEAKERICRGPVPCIVARGRKGGSTIAAAICNALLYERTR